MIRISIVASLEDFMSVDDEVCQVLGEVYVQPTDTVPCSGKERLQSIWVISRVLRVIQESFWSELVGISE